MYGRVIHSAVAIVVFLCLGSSSAVAQDWSVNARASTVTGASDNILNAEESTAADVPGPTSDLFYQLQPSATADYASPRTRHQLTYAFDAFFYLENEQANSTSHRVAWLTRWLVSPRSDLMVEVSGDVGQASTFLVEAAPETGTVELIPRGDLDFRRLSLVERYRWRASPTVRIAQEYMVRAFSTATGGEPQTNGSEFILKFGADRLWKRDAAGVEVSASLLDLHRLATAATPTSQSQTEVNVAMLGRWRREFSPRWIGTAAAGVTVTSGPSTSFTNRLRPIAEFELAYTRLWGGAALSYGRVVQPDLFSARKTVSDQGSLRGWLPLPWLRRNPTVATLALASSAALQHGSGIALETGESTGTWNTYLFDVGLTWTVADNLQLAVRYQYTDQNGDGTFVRSFARNLATLTISGELGRRRRVQQRLNTRAAAGATEPGAFAADD